MDDNEGFTVTTDLRRAFACLPGLVNPVANHEQFLELVLAVGGPGGMDRADAPYRYDPERDLSDAEVPTAAVGASP